MVFQSLSRIRLFATPWTAAHQASLSLTQTEFAQASIQSVMPSNHLLLCCLPLILPSVFPSIRVFSNELALRLGGQNIGASASVSVLSVNIQGWFPLVLTGLISLQSKGLSRVFSSTTIQKHHFFNIQPSLSHSYMTTGKNIAWTVQTFVDKVTSLLFNMLCSS